MAMNIKGAIKKARGIWGKNAMVEIRKCANYKPGKDGVVRCSGWHPAGCPTGINVYRIGKIEMGMFFCIKAEAESWEAAFEKHEANERRDHERYLEATGAEK